MSEEVDDKVGDVYVATVAINVQDMQRAVEFWCATLGYQPERLPGTRTS